MHTVTRHRAIPLALAIVALILSAEVSAGTITVTSPNGGEVWYVGEARNVTWNTSGLWGNANVFLYNNWTKVRKLATVPIQCGGWAWNIPANQLANNAYRIRVQSAVDTVWSDYSNATFTMTNTVPYAEVTSPNGGETWERGAAQVITWDSTGLWGNVNILLYYNWTKLGVIGTTPIQAGNWTWNIPLTQTPGSAYRVRVQSLLNTALSDYGNGLFGVSDYAPGALVSIPAGTFTMGNSGMGDDATYGSFDELPQHQVALGAYQIGKYEVTNQEYCDVLNWALARGYVKNSSGGAYTGGTVYGAGQALLYVLERYCQISYSGGLFVSETRDGIPMTLHPVVHVTWYGCAMYCNWVSQKQGLTPCYNTSTWALNRAAGGYHLPTEAQWERAAAWDGSKHWIYGFTSDTLTGSNRCNYYYYSWSIDIYVNPLGLLNYPYSSPVGWFDGVNVSPNGSIQTQDSASPAGCYDMSGNIWEWCHDWHGSYPGGTVSDPEGPGTGSYRLIRGGCWFVLRNACRSAYRYGSGPDLQGPFFGFRLSRW